MSEPPTPPTTPRKSSLATLKGLLPFLSPYKRQFVLAGIALLVAAGATLAIPYAFKQMIDLGFGAAGSKGIVLLVAVVVRIIVYGRRVRRLARDSQDRVADASAMAGEILNAMTTVQAFTHERIEAERFAVSVERAFATAIRRIRARSFLTLLAIVLVFGAIVFVLWLGAHAVIQGTMTGGELGQFILYSVIVAGAVGDDHGIEDELPQL